MIYKTDFRHHFRDAEADGTYGIRGYLGSFMDIASEQIYDMDRGNVQLPALCGCLWIYTKYRMVIHKNEPFLHPFHAECWIPEIKRARMTQEIEFRSNGELYCEGRVESCLLNMETRKLAPIAAARLPEGIAEERRTNTPAFIHPNYDPAAMDEVYTYEVRYSDLDKSNHMINLRYVPMFQNALPPEFYEKYHIRDVEIHYIKQIYYGEKIHILTAAGEGTVDFLALKEDGTAAAWMRLGIVKK